MQLGKRSYKAMKIQAIENTKIKVKYENKTKTLVKIRNIRQKIRSKPGNSGESQTEQVILEGLS